MLGKVKETVGTAELQRVANRSTTSRTAVSTCGFERASALPSQFDRVGCREDNIFLEKPLGMAREDYRFWSGYVGKARRARLLRPGPEIIPLHRIVTPLNTYPAEGLSEN